MQNDRVSEVVSQEVGAIATALDNLNLEVLLNRAGQARTDIAAAVAFLLSDASGHITGASIPIDGGYTAQ